MDQPPLGHKAPRPGMGRLAFCPACPNLLQTPSPLSSRHDFDLLLKIECMFYRHVLEQCKAIETSRSQEGIRTFYDECRSAGLSSETTFRYYILGLNVKGDAISVKDHLSRGGSLMRLTEAWLEIWEPQN